MGDSRENVGLSLHFPELRFFLKTIFLGVCSIKSISHDVEQSISELNIFNGLAKRPL